MSKIKLISILLIAMSSTPLMASDNPDWTWFAGQIDHIDRDTQTVIVRDKPCQVLFGTPITDNSGRNLGISELKIGDKVKVYVNITEMGTKTTSLRARKIEVTR